MLGIPQRQKLHKNRSMDSSHGLPEDIDS